ncbi:MAG: MurR/RpiR family transcriptional regulator, partial [Spirochaetaceae bacterium]
LSITDTLYVEVMKNLGDAGIAGLEKMRAAIAKRRI